MVNVCYRDIIQYLFCIKIQNLAIYTISLRLKLEKMKKETNMSKNWSFKVNLLGKLLKMFVKRQIREFFNLAKIRKSDKNDTLCQISHEECLNFMFLHLKCWPAYPYLA